MSPYEVIGKLYTFLNECNSAELTEAARLASDSDLGEALTELARIKRHLEGTKQQPEVKVPAKRVSLAVQDEVSRKSPPPRNGIDSRLERIVTDPAVFKTNVDVAKFLSSLGLDAAFRKKDGRQLMLQKLVAAVQLLDDDTRKKTLAKIYTLVPKSETAGWFDAIRGETE